jgi:hypothetical protein
MTEVVDFLERIRKAAQLSYATLDDLDRVLKGTDIVPALRAAILTRDSAQMENFLGQAPFCGYFLPGQKSNGCETGLRSSREPAVRSERSSLQSTVAET